MVVESLVDSLQLAGKGEAVLETELPLPLAARRTILVVDADAAILQEFSELLTHRDIHILFASGAEDALRQASDFIFKIDLLVSDFQMSGMTGIDLAAEMSRERPELCSPMGCWCSMENGVSGTCLLRLLNCGR